MFKMNVYPTKLTPNGIQHYQAAATIPGVYGSVTAIATTRITAIAACGIKVEAKLKAIQRRTSGVRRINVSCSC